MADCNSTIRILPFCKCITKSISQSKLIFCILKHTLSTTAVNKASIATKSHHHSLSLTEGLQSEQRTVWYFARIGNRTWRPAVFGWATSNDDRDDICDETKYIIWLKKKFQCTFQVDSSLHIVHWRSVILFEPLACHPVFTIYTSVSSNGSFSTWIERKRAELKSCLRIPGIKNWRLYRDHGWERTLIKLSFWILCIEDETVSLLIALIPAHPSQWLMNWSDLLLNGFTCNTSI